MRRIEALPEHLAEVVDEAREAAASFGLDFFETIFEVVDYDRINEIAAYGGFPTRYPHWRFGMEYEQLSKSSQYGLSRIYEMVINNDPAYAYLLEGNSIVEQRIVAAHVFGHVDFFKNNFYFSQTDRKMVDRMANHATRVRRYIDALGLERVETFLDTCLSLDNLIDFNAPFIRRPEAREPYEGGPGDRQQVKRLPASDYMDRYINPPEFIAEQERKQREEEEKRRQFPQHPQLDVLQFLIDYAPLDSWERDLLTIIRSEAYYFAPQGMTKIMNEGWASYWHSRILTEKTLRPDEFIDFADSHSAVVATSPKRLNPYKLGIELWRDIEERWNRGMFGPEWEHCDDLAQRESWDRQLGEGQAKIFQIRKLYNDITFIDEFLTPDFVERQRLYSFGYNPRRRAWSISSREFDDIKKQLLDSLTNFGQPAISVVDANFRNRGELLLSHRFEGNALDIEYGREVLENLYRLWRRPVFIETVWQGSGRLFGFDGDGHHDEKWEYRGTQR